MSARFRFIRIALAAAISFAIVASAPASAHGPYGSSQGPSGASELSALSMLPVAVSVAAPAVLVVGASALTVVAVESTVQGTVWVLERASDGVRTSVHFAGHASAAVGTALVVTAVSTGWVLSAAGAAIAFIPNEIGRALLHNERITR